MSFKRYLCNMKDSSQAKMKLSCAQFRAIIYENFDKQKSLYNNEASS